MAYCVLHGFQASAGQPAMMSKALREIGVEAFNVVIGGNKFKYPADYAFEDASNDSKRRILAQLAAKADVIHIHAITPFFNKGALQFPMGTDLLALKAAGKRVIVHFRGSEIRLASVFAASTPYHYVDDDPEGLISKFPEQSQRTYISMCQALADEVVVSDPELGTYVDNAAVIPRVIDFSAWKYVGLKKNKRPLVVHAPSRRGVKGTKYVLAAVESLKAKGLEFDFQLVENMPQREARAVLEKCDILVDQLRIGWYGVLAVEGMALGKCVISYVRKDLEKHLGDEPPIKLANPDTIESSLSDVIHSEEERMRIAQ